MRRIVSFFFVVPVVVLLSVSALYAQEELFEKGRSAYLKKDYSAAVKYLSEYTSRKPDPEALYLLGYANYEVRRKGTAVGKKDFWGDSDTTEYFKGAYLIDPKVSAKSIDMKHEK
jgi:hypothetical protein